MSYFYIETAFHHEGNFDYLKKMVSEAKKTGCHGVKFQVLTVAEEFISTKHDSFEQLKDYCLTEAQWGDIFQYTTDLGLEIILMPLNTGAFNLVDKFHVAYIDIHSVSFNDQSLLEKVKESGVAVLLSTGGRNINEIDQLVNFYGAQMSGLLVGFQGFPSLLSDVKLGRIQVLKNKYPNLQIGYADHSRFDEEYAISSSIYARFLGATVFEKHVTLDEGDLNRVDSVSAISFSRLKQLIDEIKFIDSNILVDADQFRMTEAEQKYRNRELKVVVNRDVSKGEIISEDMVALKMVSGEEVYFSNISDVLGKRLSVNKKIDEPINKGELNG